MKKIDIVIGSGEPMQINIKVPGENGAGPTRIAFIRFDCEGVRVKLLDDGYISVIPNSPTDVSVNFEF